MFSDTLKDLRHNNNLTQKDFAEKIELSKSAVSMYEQTDYGINVQYNLTGKQKRLLKAYGCAPEYAALS